MLVIAGRPAALGELSGPGRNCLAERITPGTGSGEGFTVTIGGAQPT